jgi:plasmid stability protein
MIRTITVTLPEDVYTQLEARAQTATRSVEDVVRETLVRSLPPAPEPDLSPAIQAELNAMEQLSDEALWAIAHSTANDDKIALYDVLIERQQTHTLTAEGRHLLTQLRDEADALMLRKAHAYVLLQSRGYALPSLDELHAQTP